MAIHRFITFIVKHISLSHVQAVSGKTPYSMPYTKEFEREYYFLVKALIKDGCSMVWLYSKTHKRLLRITDRNYANIFDYDSLDTGINSSGKDDIVNSVTILNVMQKLLSLNGEQILLYFDQNTQYIRLRNKGEPTLLESSCGYRYVLLERQILKELLVPLFAN